MSRFTSDVWDPERAGGWIGWLLLALAGVTAFLFGGQVLMFIWRVLDALTVLAGA